MTERAGVSAQALFAVAPSEPHLGELQRYGALAWVGFFAQAHVPHGLWWIFFHSLRDFDGGHFEVFLGDFLLAELEFDAARVVVRDEGGVADLVDERFATACEIIGIEEAAGMACNAESNAARASCFSRWLAVQCLPNSRLRLGVRYPGRVR